MGGAPRRRYGWVLAVTTLLALPAQVSAKDLFVSKFGTDSPSCGAESSPCLTVAAAAFNAGVGDTVRIGPGRYQEAVSTDKGLTFVGAGPGTEANFDPTSHTFIDATATQFAALRLTKGGGLRSLRARGKHEQPDSNGCRVGIHLESALSTPVTYEVSDVLAIGSTNNDSQAFEGRASCSAILAKDATRTIEARITDSVTQLFTTGLELDGPNVNATLTRHRALGGARVGLVANKAADATVIDSNISTVRIPDGGNLSVVRSRVRALSVGGGPSPGARVEVRDSAIVGLGAVPVGLEAGDPFKATELGSVVFRATGSTFLATPSGLGGMPAALIARADANGGTGGDVEVTLVNTAVRNHEPETGGVDILADAKNSELATVNATNSAYSSAAARNGASITPPGVGGNVTGDPRFVDPATGDVHLRRDSPLVDAGDGGALQPDELDLERQARSQDGNGDCTPIPDIGALELAQPAGTVCNEPPDTTAPTLVQLSLTNKRFRVGGASDLAAAQRKSPKGTAFRFDLSEAGRIEVELARLLAGRSFKGRCRKASRRLRRRPKCRRSKPAGGLNGLGVQGANALRFSGRIGTRRLAPGRYRATLVAVDGVGNRSAPVAIGFRILRR